jgi:hypothetical protein
MDVLRGVLSPRPLAPTVFEHLRRAQVACAVSYLARRTMAGKLGAFTFPSNTSS